MTESHDERHGEEADTASLCRVTVQITADGARLEISRPYEQQPGTWLAILDAIADRIGSYGNTNGERTFWAELSWARPGFGATSADS